MWKERENYLTKAPNGLGKQVLPWLALFFFTVGWLSISYPEEFRASAWVNSDSIFQRGEYWRLFTALFAHGDFGHLAGNAFLFLPLSYFLLSYFPKYFLLSFLLAAVTNALTIHFYAPDIYLLGISGWVFVLGGAWLGLTLLIDHRERWNRRWGSALFLGLMLFVPDQIRPGVSYLSHFFGFILGAASSGVYFWWNRDYFLEFKRYEYIATEKEIDFDQTSNSIPSLEITKSTEEN